MVDGICLSYKDMTLNMAWDNHHFYKILEWDFIIFARKYRKQFLEKDNYKTSIIRTTNYI